MAQGETLACPRIELMGPVVAEYFVDMWNEESFYSLKEQRGMKGLD